MRDERSGSSQVRCVHIRNVNSIKCWSIAKFVVRIHHHTTTTYIILVHSIRIDELPIGQYTLNSKFIRIVIKCFIKFHIIPNDEMLNRRPINLSIAFLPNKTNSILIVLIVLCTFGWMVWLGVASA